MTECSYDYVFVYDGDSPLDQNLLASLSGDGIDHSVPLTATSGSMLILFFSDLNYVLRGFRARYYARACPLDCSGHGDCLQSRCQCHTGWVGPACRNPACLVQDCRGRGVCDPQSGCVCQAGFAGVDCGLELDSMRHFKPTWHRLPHTEADFAPRTGHTSTYLKSTDSIYFYGGIDLGAIRGDLESFSLESQKWTHYDYLQTRPPGTA